MLLGASPGAGSHQDNRQAVIGQPPLPPGLIVNADDLGIHPSINAGIFSAYRRGILTSATMLMTTPYAQATAAQVRSETIPVGVHLSLTLGRPAANPGTVPDLLDEQGAFKSSALRLLLQPFTSDQQRQLLVQIRTEFEAQIGLALDCGLQPTHVDSHQHVHMNPAIFRLVEELLPRFGIQRLRYSREQASRAATNFLEARYYLNFAKVALLGTLSRQIKPELATPDRFFGVLHSGLITRRVLQTVIRLMPAGRSLEICIHPGLPAGDKDAPYPRSYENDFIQSSKRRTEHDALIDPEVGELVRKHSIVLRSFNGAAKNS
jgi:predicted glycoside hydrolase/deacetylase ChbG (UPF0249 family)